MKGKVIILHPNPIGVLAPKVTLNIDTLKVVGNEESYNYAISTDYGSVILKGMFVEQLELKLEITSIPELLQLDVFNSNGHFSYNFKVITENL